MRSPRQLSASGGFIPDKGSDFPSFTSLFAKNNPLFSPCLQRAALAIAFVLLPYFNFSIFQSFHFCRVCGNRLRPEINPINFIFVVFRVYICGIPRPEGATTISPGQRPGVAGIKRNCALKGQLHNSARLLKHPIRVLYFPFFNLSMFPFCGIFQMKNADNEPLKTGHGGHQLLFCSEIRQK